jgi:hypothetical protein
MEDRLVKTGVHILRSLPSSGLHTNAIIKQTSRDRTHVIAAIRLLERGRLIRVQDEKNWKFGQKKTIIPTGLGFEIKTLMEDLDRYNDALSRFKQTRRQFVDNANFYSTIWVEKDHIKIDDRSGIYKVKEQAEANKLMTRMSNATRSRLKSAGWTDEEIELSDSVEFGLSLVNEFCEGNIFSALGHRYVFIFHGFNLDKNEVARNMLTEIITSEQEKQLNNLLLGGWGKGFPDRKEKNPTIDRIYHATYNQIVDPILRDLQDVLDIEKYEEQLAEKLEETKEICHSLLFNRFVSSDVKNVISSFLKVLHHYTIRNSTPHIDQTRIFQRANLMSGIRRIDKELKSKRKTLSRNKMLGLEVAKEYNSLLELWFRRDDEGESDENSLWNSIDAPHTQPTSHQSDEEYASHNDKSNGVDGVRA